MFLNEHNTFNFIMNNPVYFFILKFIEMALTLN